MLEPRDPGLRDEEIDGFGGAVCEFGVLSIEGGI